MRRLASYTQAVVLTTALLGCSRGVGADKATGSAGAFVNRVWRVESSSSVARGTIYVFLSEGTLLVTSSNNKPLLGTWKYDNGDFTMVEEGIPYRVEVLHLSRKQFKIRSHNPGEPVEITLVPAQAF
jgi:hypothetical protein